MKRILAKTGSYTNKEGEEKNEWTKIGVILSNDNGEYIIFDPTVSMAGIAYKQRVNGIAKQGADSVIASIFMDEPKQNQSANNAPQSQGAPANDFDDLIPF